jgi:large subunit ribosomal protein L10
MKKSEKPFFVENLTQELKDASSVVLVDHSGLSVKMQQDLKKRLRSVGGAMSVVKNTLFKRAGKEAKVNEKILEEDVLSGPTALIIGQDDPVAPLQVLYKFAKENEIPNLKVGIIEGNFQDKDTLEKIAQLPSKEILTGQAIGAIASPMYGIIGVLQGNIQKLLYIVKSAAEKK